jgi:hypothetical protein
MKFGAFLGVVAGVLVVAQGAQAFEWGDGPFQASLYPPIQLRGPTKSVTGFRFNLGKSENWEVKGLDVGIVNCTDERFVGYGFGLANFVGGDVNGTSVGMCNWAGFNVRGSQCGLINMVEEDVMGNQIGIWNQTKSLNGCQLGLINKAWSVSGMQLGLINYSGYLEGVQFGLFNIVTERESWSYMPFLNFSL